MTKQFPHARRATRAALLAPVRGSTESTQLVAKERDRWVCVIKLAGFTEE